jgi:hypothetical protein
LQASRLRHGGSRHADIRERIRARPGARPWRSRSCRRWRMGTSLFWRQAILRSAPLHRSPLSASSSFRISASSPFRICGCLSLLLRRWLLLAKAPGTRYGQPLLVASLLRLSARVLLTDCGRVRGLRATVCAVPATITLRQAACPSLSAVSIQQFASVRFGSRLSRRCPGPVPLIPMSLREQTRFA